MSAWIYQHTNWMVDREHPVKTIARFGAIALSMLPLILGLVIVASR